MAAQVPGGAGSSGRLHPTQSTANSVCRPAVSQNRFRPASPRSIPVSSALSSLRCPAGATPRPAVAHFGPGSAADAFRAAAKSPRSRVHTEFSTSSTDIATARTSTRRGFPPERHQACQGPPRSRAEHSKEEHCQGSGLAQNLRAGCQNQLSYVSTVSRPEFKSRSKTDFPAVDGDCFTADADIDVEAGTEFSES